MIIDCDTCQVRGDACGDCVVTALLGAPPQEQELDPEHRRAIDVLAEHGLISRALRSLPLTVVEHTPPPSDAERRDRGGGRNRRAG